MIDYRAFEAYLQAREQQARDFELVCRPRIRDGKRAHRRLWDLIHLGNIRSGVPARNRSSLRRIHPVTVHPPVPIRSLLGDIIKQGPTV